MNELDVARNEVERLARVIGAPGHMLPTHGRSEDFARPHIEFDGRYHFVVVERGQELTRITGSLEEVLYRVFDGVTSQMASIAAAGKPRFRENRFAGQLALMARLHPAWQARCAAEIDDILIRAPQVDGA